MKPRILIPHPNVVDLQSLKKMTDQINHVVQDVYKKIPDSPVIANTSQSNGLIWDQTVGKDIPGPRASIASPTLDGLAHGGYWFEFIIINTVAAATNYAIYFNKDTTAANYNKDYYERSGVTIAALGAADALAIGINANLEMHVVGDIILSPSGTISLTGQSKRLGTDNLTRNFGLFKLAKVTNLTSLDIVGSANSIGLNSRFRLWRKI